MLHLRHKTHRHRDNRDVKSIDVTPRLLQQYLVLAEERHFGRAADRLQISQPSLSQAINRLEQALGVALLNRTSRKFALTPAGAAFAKDAQGVVEAQHAAIMRAHRIALGDEGELNLGTTGSFAYSLIPGLIRLCRDEIPKLRIRIQDCPSMELVERVRSGRVDVALLIGPLPDSTDLTVSFVADERIVVALPANHRLADRASIQLSDLADEDFAVLSKAGHGGILPLAAAACQAAGFVPREVASADTAAGLIGHVASTRCVSLAPERMRLFAPQGVVFRPVESQKSGDTADPAEILKVQILSVVRADRDDASVSKILRLLRNPAIFETIPLQ